MKSTNIKGGLFFSPDRRFEKKDLLVAEKRIALIDEDIPVRDSYVISAENMYVVPGFIDLHTHGAFGSDVMLHGEQGLFALSRFFASKGVTGFLPTVMTAPVPEIKRALRSICNVMKNGVKGSKILGINMEGPFINESFKGAHDRKNIIMPSVELFEDILEASGNNLKMVTIAPELPCSREIISKYGDRIIFSAGHTAADSSIAEEAFNYGMHHVTHLFNAMQSMHHREPYLLGAALDDDNVSVEIIADGIHVSPKMIRLALKCKGPMKTVLITDSIMAAGHMDGAYSLGGTTVYVNNKEARLEDGSLAGSTLTMIDAVKNMVKFKVSLEDALTMASIAPADVLGISHRKGKLEAGMDADIVILNRDLNVVMTMVEGSLEYMG